MGEALRRQLIDANPCTIRGAGSVRSPERPYLEPASVWAIIDAAPDGQRAAWTLAYGAHLRLGELLALRTSDLNLTAASPTVRVERQFIEVGGQISVTPTKTKERRTIDLSPSIASDLREHLASMPAGLPSALLFTRPDGSPLRHRQVQTAWRAAREAAGFPSAHFHDLRHAGLTLAAMTGISQRELMQRGGHSTPHASLIYQHVAKSRGAEIASAMDVLLRATRKSS
jgi:integrase